MTPHNYKKITSSDSKKEERSHKNHIYIFGTQRCVGLSSALLRSRENTRYQKYGVTSLTKPFALTADIMKNIKNIQVKPRDKIVICFGENDYDIQIMTLHLRRMLKHFINNDVIVINVLKNVYLNVKDLNDTIKNVCNEYQNCHFIDCKNRNIFNLCKNINYIIDCADYENKYLNPKELKKIIISGRPISQNHRCMFLRYPKGTIPYYLGPQLGQVVTTNANVNTTPQSSTTAQQSPPKIQSSHTRVQSSKGTVPHFFSRAISRNNSYSDTDIIESSRLNQTTLPQFFPRINKNNSFRASKQ